MVQASVKNWSKYVAQTKLDQFLTLEMLFFFCFFFFFLFFEKSSSFCRENEIFKTKKQKMDQFLTLEKGKIWTSF